jgi:uncharacterized short protein YbdD (DUF466 family)
MSQAALAPQRSIADSFRAILVMVRRVIGVPDYDRYVSHMRGHHPECTPLSVEEFTRERLEDKYSRPGSRCC